MRSYQILRFTQDDNTLSLGQGPSTSLRFAQDDKARACGVCLGEGGDWGQIPPPRRAGIFDSDRDDKTWGLVVFVSRRVADVRLYGSAGLALHREAIWTTVDASLDYSTSVEMTEYGGRFK